ncbi:MAG TPA: hypothetical protein VF538_07790 [Pyrinomonadaceae bacterium]
MIRSVSLLACCAFTVGGFGLVRQARAERAHDEWLRARYFEAASVKGGMTRADLIKIFRADGGLQPPGVPTRYVLKSSDMIKVDVEFESPAGAKGRVSPEGSRREAWGPDAGGNYLFVPDEKLKIRSVSKPYLEPSAYD